MKDSDFLTLPLDTSTVQLDYLFIDIHAATDAIQLLDRLKTLHENGFFKKLRVSYKPTPRSFDNELFIREIMPFCAEEFYILKFYPPAMCDLTQLKKLHLMNVHRNVNFDTLAMNLIDLERLLILGTVEQFSSFLRHSKKLKFVFFIECKLNFMHNDGYNVVDLFKLNRMREMSGIKHQIQIGLYRHQYVATKWKTNHLKFDFIEITREASIFFSMYE